MKGHEMNDTAAQYTGCTMPVQPVLTFIDILDSVVSKLKALADLSPLVDEAPMEDKGRVAIGLLDIVSDYVEQLDGAIALFSNRLPRCQEGEWPWQA
jgi:hypothetical protein